MRYIGVKIDEETHKALKIYLINHKSKIQEFVLDLIKKTIEKEPKKVCPY